MIEQSRLDRIRQYNVEDIIGRLVPLQKKGRELVACCPFHEEKTPSFSVSPAKGIYKCFGCGASGDAIGFIENHQRLSFSEAVEWIEREVGVLHQGAPAPPPRRTAPPPPLHVFKAESVDKGLAYDEGNPFHRFLTSRFNGSGEKLIRRFGVATSTKHFFDGGTPKTAFWYRDAAGQYLNAKIVPYAADGHRMKQKGNKAYEPFWAKAEGEGYGKCLFGEFQLGEYPETAWVGLVESEKTVVVCSYYVPQVCWLAKGSATGLTEGKTGVLKGRMVAVFPDADEAGRKAAGADGERLSKVAGAVRVVDLFPGRDDKTDIADWLLSGEVSGEAVMAALVRKSEAAQPPAARPAPPPPAPPPEAGAADPVRAALEFQANEWLRAGRDMREALQDINLEYLCVQFAPLPAGEIKAIVGTVYERNAGEAGMMKKDPFQAAQQFFSSRYEFRENLLTEQRLYRLKKGGPWKDLDVDELYTQMRNNGIKCSKGDVASLLNRESNFTQFNPIDDYFRSLPRWDGADHIGRMAAKVILKSAPPVKVGEQTMTHQAFWAAMFRKALVRHIACSVGRTSGAGHAERIPNRIVMSLVSGAEEIGKSRFVRMICPPELREHYTEEPVEDNKDTRKRLATCLIYNLEEFEFGKKSVAAFKSLISQDQINIRGVFKQQARRQVRICNFWATTNEQQFLRDSSYTRWMIFEVEKFDGSLWETDMRAVWAQAWALFQQGENGQLTDAEKAVRNQRNQGYAEVDEYVEMLDAYFVRCEKGKGEFMNATAVRDWLNKNVNQRVLLSPVHLGRRLARMGFERDKMGTGYGYWVMFRSSVPSVQMPEEQVGF